jgi:dTDP-4-dehydrorhamnose 3,5-epimerase
MNLVKTEFEDLVLLEPKVFGDHRGYFLESYNEDTFLNLGLKYKFVQDNESFSSFGTLRGLHFQRGEFAQAKLVRVLKGKVLDVVVDLRPESKTFKKFSTFELSEENKRILMVPRGFAHGFVVLSQEALFQYKCDNFYSPENESGIIWNDPDLNIDWKISDQEVIISEKDAKLSFLRDLDL